MIESKLLRDNTKLKRCAKSSEQSVSIDPQINSRFIANKQNSALPNHYQGYLLSSYRSYLGDEL